MTVVVICQNEVQPAKVEFSGGNTDANDSRRDIVKYIRDQVISGSSKVRTKTTVIATVLILCQIIEVLQTEEYDCSSQICVP